MEPSTGIAYKKGYKYQLTKDFIIKTPFVGHPCETIYYQLDIWGYLTIKRLYAWDGPSGPAPDLKFTLIGSLVHDCLCQMRNEGHLPQEFDQLIDQFFSLTNWEAGMPRLLRGPFYAGVRANRVLHIVGPEKLRHVDYKRDRNDWYFEQFSRMVNECHDINANLEPA